MFVKTEVGWNTSVEDLPRHNMQRRSFSNSACYALGDLLFFLFFKKHLPLLNGRYIYPPETNTTKRLLNFHIINYNKSIYNQWMSKPPCHKLCSCVLNSPIKRIPKMVGILSRRHRSLFSMQIKVPPS